MAGEDNKAIYRRFVEEVVNQGHFNVVDELYAPDYVDHAAPPGAPGGLMGVKMIMGMFRTAFPDVHFTIIQMVAEGDMVATFVTGEGTNNGPFMGRPASGKHAKWNSTGFFRVKDGRIVEHWGVPDLLAIMSQIGAIPH
jgi:predicted ester cyclase